MLLREVEEGQHPPPVACTRGAGLGVVGLAVAPLELAAFTLAAPSAGGVHHELEEARAASAWSFLAKQSSTFTIWWFRALLAAPSGCRSPERRPDAEVAVGDAKTRQLQPSFLEIAQDRRPGLLALALARLAQASRILSPLLKVETITSRAFVRSSNPAFT